MSSAWREERIDLKLQVRYQGLKATQYFSKYTADSEAVFREDLTALKLPLPKSSNITFVSYGCVECVWPGTNRTTILYRNITLKTSPSDPEQQHAYRQLLNQLSIVKLAVKEIPSEMNAPFPAPPRFPVKKYQGPESSSNPYNPAGPSVRGSYSRPAYEADRQEVVIAPPPAQVASSSKDPHKAPPALDKTRPIQQGPWGRLPEPAQRSRVDKEATSSTSGYAHHAPLPPKRGPSSNTNQFGGATATGLHSRFDVEMGDDDVVIIPPPTQRSQAGLDKEPPPDGTQLVQHFLKNLKKPPTTTSSPTTSKETAVKVKQEVIEISLEESMARERQRIEAAQRAAEVQRLTREYWDVKRVITGAVARETTILSELKALGSTWMPEPTILAEQASEDMKQRITQLEEELEVERTLRRSDSDAKDRFSELEAQLLQERRLREEAENAIDDVRRECRAPFVVPSLLAAFLDVSKLTTRAMMPAES
ncbi:hypothetical protein CPC08DRAFT_821098 [Agrocybe pediades]|nr:hypothetical protein CPC08DRAFT_821098 [Agrocybe pediades]